MKLNELKQPIAIEQLVFTMDPADVPDWISLDHTIWTAALSACPGFVKKEIWQAPEKPGEVTSVVYWESMELWKSISTDLLSDTLRRFDEAFGRSYELIGELHHEKQMFITHTVEE